MTDPREADQLRSQIAALEQLLEVHERTTIEQSERLEHLLGDLRERTRRMERSEERYALATRATADVIWDWDLLSDELVWNEALETTFGYPPAAVPQTIGFWYEHVHPDDRDRVVHGIHATIDGGGTTWSDEYRFLTADGIHASVLDRGFIARDESGTATRMIGSMQDTTEREQLIQALDTERARLREVFQQAPALIAVTRGPEHVFELANPPYLQTLGNRELIGKTMREALPELEGQPFFDLVDRVFATGEPYVGNEVHVMIDRQRDGALQEGYFNFVYQPLFDLRGAVYGILTHAVEVSEQVAARREVEAKAEELSRTAQALETTNRELDQFAYVASHDLKAPLRGIANLSQWIEEDFGADVPEEAREHMNLLRGRVHRMEGLIDGILEYSRAGRVREQPEEVDVDALIHEVLDLQAPPETVTVVVAPKLPILHTERLPLQQVFMNLIGNAVKYTRRPDARVEVGGRTKGSLWEFFVRDNGPGIAPEYHERIFGIFQTLEARDKVEGTGIGLSLVKKLVEARGGRIAIESEEGAGATFTFTWATEDRNPPR